MPPPLHAIFVAVVDTCSNRQRLLAATLYAMGCRVLSITCDSLVGPSVAAQITIAMPDVIVWHVDSGGTCGPLQQLLNSDGVGGAGVVVTMSDPVEPAARLDAGPVHMLAVPFTPAGLMKAVVAAYEHKPHTASVS